MPEGSITPEIGEVSQIETLQPQDSNENTPENADTTTPSQEEPGENEAQPQQETPPTDVPETVTTPEKKMTRQEEEINTLAEVLINKKLREITDSPNEDNKALTSTLQSLNYFNQPKTENLVSSEKPDGAVLPGKPLIVTWENKQYDVIAIKKSDEETITCQVKDGEAEVEVALPRDVLYKAQLDSERETILQGFPEDQRVIIDLYIQGQIEDMSVLESYPPEKINKFITEVATNAGIMTTDDLRAFIDSKYPEPDPNKKLTVDDLKIVDRRREAFRIIDNKVIVDPQLVSDFFISIGGTDELGKGVAKLELEIQALEEMKVKADRRGEAVSKEVAEELDNKKREKKAYESITSGDAMEAYFSQVLDGTLDQEESKDLIRAFRTGDSKNIIDTTFKNTLSKLPPEVYEKHKREIEAFQKNLFNKSGAGIFALLWIAFELSMTLKDAVK